MKNPTPKHKRPQRKVHQNFEAVSHLKTFVSYQLDDTTLTAGLLSSTRRFDSSSPCELVFGLNYVPIHAGDQNLDTTGERLAANLKSMPPQGSCTFAAARWADDHSTQARLRQREQQAHSPEVKMALLYEQKLIQSLTRQGVRREASHRLYLHIPVPKREPSPDTDLLTATIRRTKAVGWWFSEKALSFIQRIEGQRGQHQNKDLHRRLLQAHELAQEWLRFLRNHLDLAVRPLTEQELAQAMRERFFLRDDSPAPHRLVVTTRDIQEEIRSRYSPAMQFLQMEIPQGNGRYVRVGNRFAGIVTLAEKPGGWIDRVAQLRYLYELQQSHSYVDIVCLTQINLGRQDVVALDLAWMRKQSRATLNQSIEQGDYSLVAESRLNETEDAERKLQKGERILQCATVFIVYRYSLDALETACQQLCSRFTRPALAVRETIAARSIWLQSLPITTSPLQKFSDSLAGQYFVKDFDRRLRLFSSEAVGLMPLLADVSADGDGLEMLTQSGTLYYLNPFEHRCHTFIAGATRSGKSLLECMRILLSLMMGIPVVVVDYSFTFVDLCHFMNGAVYDILQESINLFEIPDTRRISDKRAKEIDKQWQKTVFSTLMIMIVGNQEETALTKSIQSVLEIALKRFAQDEAILKRFYRAYDAGIDSEAWAAMPTIHDFLGFCKFSQFRDLGGYVEEACQAIQLSLTGWLNKPGIGDAISQPSSFAANDHFTLFLLTGLSDDEGAAVMAALAQIAANRVTARYEACHFVLDEASVFMSYRWLNNMMGSLFAEGLKRGIFVDQIAQDIDTTYRSANGPKIFQNTDTVLIGRIQAAAQQSYTDYLRIPPDLIAENAQESYFPNPNDCYSNWLVVQSGRYTQCRWYASPFLLAISVNNPPERKARNLIMQHYPNKFEAIAIFAELLQVSIKSGHSVLELTESHLQTQSVTHV